MMLVQDRYKCNVFQTDTVNSQMMFDAKRHFHHYFSYIVEVSFIVEGNRSTRRKPPTCLLQVTHFGVIALFSSNFQNFNAFRLIFQKL